MFLCVKILILTVQVVTLLFVYSLQTYGFKRLRICNPDHSDVYLGSSPANTAADQYQNDEQGETGNNNA